MTRARQSRSFERMIPLSLSGPLGPMLELNRHMDPQELKYWIAFNRVPRIGRARSLLLESHFGSLRAAWEALVTQQIEMTAMFPEDGSESELLDSFIYESIYIDEIIRDSGLAILEISGKLAMMSLKGLTKQVGGMSYIRRGETSAEYLTV